MAAICLPIRINAACAWRCSGVLWPIVPWRPGWRAVMTIGFAPATAKRETLPLS